MVEKNLVVNSGSKAEIRSKADGPNIAVICEYDALPVIDHACGHNLLAEAGIAAAVSLSAALKSLETPPG